MPRKLQEQDTPIIDRAHVEQGWQQWSPIIMVWSCLLLLPFGRAVELSVLIMMVLGIRLVIKQGKQACWAGASRLFSTLFLLMWIPAWLSLPDAANLTKGLEMSAGALRFYFAGLFTLHALATPLARQRFLCLSAWLLVFWVGDALIQAVIGRDVFGFVYPPQRLNGVFGEDNYRLGWALAAFAPFLFMYAHRRWPLSVLGGLFVATLVVILLSGTRGAWVMLLVILGGYAIMLWNHHKRTAIKLSLLVLVAGIAISVGSYFLSPQFAARVQTTALLFKGDAVSVDTALSFRLPIWKTAWNTLTQHPINGVGVGGFRYTYREYAGPGDLFVTQDSPTGASHPHQLLLEVAAEMGLIGLLGLFAAWGLIVKTWRQANATQRAEMLPYGLVLLAIFFPINSHLAAYSSSWGQVVWFAIALFCAAASAQSASRNATEP